MLDSYHSDGFLVVEGLFASEELAEARARLERVQAAVAGLPEELRRHLVLERDLPAAKRGGIPAERTGEAIFIVGALPLFGPAFLRLLAARRVLDLLAPLLGGEPRYHFSNATIKHPGFGSGIAFHRDFPNRYICPAGASFVRAMLCLDDNTGENGATQFHRGSHRGGEGDLVTAACPAGSLILIHPEVLHGGAVNRSARIRRNLIAQWGRAEDPPRGESEILTGASPAEIAAWLAVETSLAPRPQVG